MKLTLPRFGSQEISVDPQSVVVFPGGIPGFEQCTRFALLHEGENPSIYWLQSLDDANVVFSLADPDQLNIDYEVTLSEAEQKALQVGEGDELSLAVILSKADGSGNTQVHMKCPIIINATKRVGIQKALRDAGLAIRGN